MEVLYNPAREVIIIIVNNSEDYLLELIWWINAIIEYNELNH